MRQGRRLCHEGPNSRKLEVPPAVPSGSTTSVLKEFHNRTQGVQGTPPPELSPESLQLLLAIKRPCSGPHSYRVWAGFNWLSGVLPAVRRIATRVQRRWRVCIALPAAVGAAGYFFTALLPVLHLRSFVFPHQLKLLAGTSAISRSSARCAAWARKAAQPPTVPPAPQCCPCALLLPPPSSLTCLCTTSKSFRLATFMWVYAALGPSQLLAQKLNQALSAAHPGANWSPLITVWTDNVAGCCCWLLPACGATSKGGDYERPGVVRAGAAGGCISDWSRIS